MSPLKMWQRKREKQFFLRFLIKQVNEEKEEKQIIKITTTK